MATLVSNPLEGVSVVLAPLAGITDAIFRGICMDHGADMVFSEMISADGLARCRRRLRALRDLDTGNGRIALQIFGSDPAIMGEAAAVLSEYDPSLIDINLGCPVRKVVKRNGGAALLKDLRLLERVCAAVVRRSAVPVSAKVRAGWSDASETGVRDLGRALERAGISVITVHARSRAQAFQGLADWSLIAAMKDTVSVPVIGNGDVWSAEDYFRIRSETNCDAVMIGRGAVGNPWIFEEIQARREGRDFSPPSHRARLETMLDHVGKAVSKLGEPLGVVTSRKVMAAYARHLPNARDVRRALMKCERLAELACVMDDFRNAPV
jgi:tRNA-dihydrouridine synthase B